MRRIGLDVSQARSGITSGFTTGLFSIPEGMAYAQLAGVNPVYGLYSGIVGTIVASLSTGSLLMISTLTSAIALATASVLSEANVSDSDFPAALFTITLLVGGIMFLTGLLRMGSLVSFVSNAVMTGFVAAASLLIIVGELGDFSGYDPSGGNKLAEIFNWIVNIDQWDVATTLVGISTIVVMLVLRVIKPIERLAAVLALLLMSVVVWALDPSSVALVGSVADIPRSLPNPELPDFSLIPKLALGSTSVAIVALVQGAGISTAYPNPDGTRASTNRDFMGQGLGNLAGSFFQSMSTGGSLSRTGISVSAGASSRWGGVFAGLWVAVLIVLFAPLAEEVPLAVIAGLLFVIGAELIIGRLPDAMLVIRSGSYGSMAAGLLTFGSAFFISLQWTIFLGAGLTLLVFLQHSASTTRMSSLVRNEDGKWEDTELPATFPSNEATVVNYEGAQFFAEVPRLRERLPSLEGTSGAVIILRAHGLLELHSTGLKMLLHFVRDLKRQGNVLMIEGIEPGAMNALRRTGVVAEMGEGRVFVRQAALTGALDDAWFAAQRWIDEQTSAHNP